MVLTAIHGGKGKLAKEMQDYMCKRSCIRNTKDHCFLWFLSSRLEFYILCWSVLHFHMSARPRFTGKNAVSTLFVGYRNERWQAFPQCLWCVLIISCHTECIYNMDFKNWPQDMGVLHWKLNRTAWLPALEYSFICSVIYSFIQKKHCPRHCIEWSSWTLPS